jgi:predicted amidohydrolase
MPRRLQVAAVQMDAAPAPVAERLVRAERQVDAAAAAGAQLVLLPELFTTGYCYEPATLALAEPPDGPSSAWMGRTTARLGIHLAGSLLLREGGDVVNSLLLVAPDGQRWRYDKQHPWAWERATFRAGRGGPIASTALGRIGMLICWDVAHPRLWRAYAGQVDLLLIASCPPDASAPRYHLPSGATLTLDDLGPAFARLKDTGRLVFGTMIDQQVAWLGVPALHTVGCGQLQLRIPNGRGTLAVMAAAAPSLLRYLPEATVLELRCGLIAGCRIIDAGGQAIATRGQEQGEGSCVGTLRLLDAPPRPHGRQPTSPLPVLAYLLSDWVVPWLSISAYRQGLRDVSGLEGAPQAGAGGLRLLLLGLALMGVLELLRRLWRSWTTRAGGDATHAP